MKTTLENYFWLFLAGCVDFVRDCRTYFKRRWANDKFYRWYIKANLWLLFLNLMAIGFACWYSFYLQLSAML